MITKKRKCISTISIVCIFICSILISQNNHSDNNDLIYNEIDIKETEASDYWNLTSRIYIDDTNSSYNWTYTNSTYDWCDGSGTWDDPYVIENVTINGKTDSCIIIQNSEAHFVINNVTLYNSSFEGISLNNASNGKIIESKIYNNTGGIRFQSNSNNITILGNTINNNSRGIDIEESFNNTIENNVIANTNGISIWLQTGCNDSIITGNHLYNNSGAIHRGLQIDESVNNSISNNTIENCGDTGIWLKVNCNNTWIINNTVNSHTSRGIYIDESYNNTIINNTVNETPIGIALSNSSKNIIKNNTLSNPGADIDLFYCYNETIVGNKMNNTGIRCMYVISLKQITSNIVDKYNTIFGKTVYFYKNKTGLKPDDFKNVGQILMFNCNNSVVSELNISNIGTGIMLYSGQNNTFSNITVKYCQMGFYLVLGFNISVYNNTANYNSMVAIDFEGCNNSTMYNNTILNTGGYGIVLSLSHNCSIRDNYVNSSTYGIAVANSHNNTLHNNSANFHTAGLFLTGSLGNKILNNTAYNNTYGIALTSGTNHTLLCGNVLFNNTYNYYNDSTGVGNIIVNCSSNNAPKVNNPVDVSTTTSGGETIGWILTDDYAPGKYRVLANDTLGNTYVWIDWTDWLNNTVLNIAINRTRPGIFNYTIEYNDGLGVFGIIDTVIVTIKDNIPDGGEDNTPTSPPPSIQGFDIILVLSLAFVITTIILKKYKKY